MIDFELKGTDDQMHGTKATDEGKGLVIIFTCNHCPYARAYVSRIREISEKYTTEGIHFFAINSNDASRYPDDSFENMKPMAEHLGLKGKYLYDETQEVASQYTAQRTPEVFVFNSEHKLVYHGAIDDNWEYPEAVTQNYLIDVLENILNGTAPETSETQAVGCSIKWFVN